MQHGAKRSPGRSSGGGMVASFFLTTLMCLAGYTAYQQYLLSQQVTEFGEQLAESNEKASELHREIELLRSESRSGLEKLRVVEQVARGLANNGGGRAASGFRGGQVASGRGGLTSGVGGRGMGANPELRRDALAPVGGFDSDDMLYADEDQGDRPRRVDAAPGDVGRVKALINELERLPLPEDRVRAARELGYRSGAAPDEAIDALTKAYKEDASPEVRTASFEALTSLNNWGRRQKQCESLFAAAVYDKEMAPQRWTAIDALLRIDSDSSTVRRILRAALLGASRPPAKAASTSLIRQTRQEALKRIRSLRVHHDWATGDLIDVLDAEISEWQKTQLSVSRYTPPKEYLEELLGTLLRIGKGDKHVESHLRKKLDSVFSRSPDATQWRVAYDTALKRLEASR